MRFDDLDLCDELLDALYDMHFDECTPIQEMAIPVVREGHDVIAVAQTGTGKTAAYLIPIIDRLMGTPSPEDAVNCIIMSPTRELAQQIDRQMEGFAYFLPLSSVAIYGGTDGATFAQQQRGLKLGADVVISTPGRLIAHMQMGNVDLSRVNYFVLDEADRMLDMGFYDDIMQIVNKLPKERQTLMFSATMPPKIKQLARDILKDPVEIKTAVSRPADGIDQSAAVCYEEQKTTILKHLFKSHNKRVIVFAASKLKVKELTRELRRTHFKVDEMHSDLDQQRRDQVMLDFRAGRTDILIATDIVARGIDIDDITMVVNYDVPREAEDYVHRVGRTARAGTDGCAVTLVSPRDQSRFGMIEQFLDMTVKKVVLPDEYGPYPEYRPELKKKSKGKKSCGKNFSRHGKNSKPKSVGSPSSQPSNSSNDTKPESTAQKSTHRRRNRRRSNGPKPSHEA